jgi:hypothetical protein
MSSTLEAVLVMCLCRDTIDAQMQGITRCMDDLNAQLDAWEDEGRAGSDGQLPGRGALPSSSMSSVIYATLALQVRPWSAQSRLAIRVLCSEGQKQTPWVRQQHLAPLDIEPLPLTELTHVTAHCTARVTPSATAMQGLRSFDRRLSGWEYMAR